MEPLTAEEEGLWRNFPRKMSDAETSRIWATVDYERARADRLEAWVAEQPCEAKWGTRDADKPDCGFCLPCEARARRER